MGGNVNFSFVVLSGSPGMYVRPEKSEVYKIVCSATFEQVCTISALCDGKHEHNAWGIVKFGAKRASFATSLEVHYPRGLCEAIVKAFMLKFAELGMKLNHEVRHCIMLQRRCLVSKQFL